MCPCAPIPAPASTTPVRTVTDYGRDRPLPAVVKLRAVERHYRSTGFRLGPLDLEVSPGITCVVGANGAGKSTLFRILSGLESPGRGSVEHSTSRRDSRVALMPQDPDHPRQARCVDYLHHVGWLYGVPRGDRSDRVGAVLADVGLAERGNDRIAVLSGGMVRRLALAAALLPRPNLLLLDEPTSGLDPLQRIAMRETISALNGDAAVLVSTHLVEDVRGLGGQVLVLNRGNVVFAGSVHELESQDSGTGPGDTPLERAIAVLLTDGQLA